MTSRHITLLAIGDGVTASGPVDVFRPAPPSNSKDNLMTTPTPDSIDEQVSEFRNQLDALAFTDIDHASTEAKNLFISLASAPTSKATGRVLLDWATKYADAVAYRNSVVTAAVLQYALFIVFEASELEIRGKDGHLSKLSTIKITCRVLDINIGEVR